ncbi:MAG: hypothetical protein RR332_06065, partial [Clostridiales bacterium]
MIDYLFMAKNIIFESYAKCEMVMWGQIAQIILRLNNLLHLPNKQLFGSLGWSGSVVVLRGARISFHAQAMTVFAVSSFAQLSAARSCSAGAGLCDLDGRKIIHERVGMFCYFRNW